MPIYQWNPKSFGLNIPEMDAEHQILIGKMNALYDAGQKAMPKVELGALLGELTNYTRHHFEDEENYMARVGYAGAVRHKAVHQKLLKQMVDYQEFFDKTGVLTDAFWEFLTHWWTSHIRNMDFAYANAKEELSRVA